MLFGLWWVVGYCAVAGVAYILPHWQHFMLATSVPTIVCALLFWITIPESFQFLIEKGKRNDARKWIKSIEKPNDRLNCNVDYLVENVQREDDTAGMQNEASFKTSVQFLLAHRKYLWYLSASIIIW